MTRIAHTIGGRPPQSYACPTFFRALVYEARAGERSFAECGYELGRRLFAIAGEDLGEEVMGQLIVLVSKRDEANILKWLQTHVPKMMSLIPPREYRSFLRGFIKVFEDGAVEVDYAIAA